MARSRRLAVLGLIIILAGIGVAVGIDQVRLEGARSSLQRTLTEELPPGTDLATALEYLERHRYYPDYLSRANVIGAARGYDQPAFPAPVGRRMIITGHLDASRRVTRWEVDINRVFIPVP